MKTALPFIAFWALCANLNSRPVFAAESCEESINQSNESVLDSVAAEGMRAINAERTKAGVAPLQLSVELSQAADTNSQMGGGHQYVISSQCWSGYPTIESSVQAWVYYDGEWNGAHRDIVLGNYREGGFGGSPGNYTFNAR